MINTEGSIGGKQSGTRWSAQAEFMSLKPGRTLDNFELDSEPTVCGFGTNNYSSRLRSFHCSSVSIRRLLSYLARFSSVPEPFGSLCVSRCTVVKRAQARALGGLFSQLYFTPLLRACCWRFASWGSVSTTTTKWNAWPTFGQMKSQMLDITHEHTEVYNGMREWMKKRGLLTLRPTVQRQLYPYWQAMLSCSCVLTAVLLFCSALECDCWVHICPRRTEPKGKRPLDSKQCLQSVQVRNTFDIYNFTSVCLRRKSRNSQWENSGPGSAFS